MPQAAEVDRRLSKQEEKRLPARQPQLPVLQCSSAIAASSVQADEKSSGHQQLPTAASTETTWLPTFPLSAARSLEHDVSRCDQQFQVVEDRAQGPSTLLPSRSLASEEKGWPSTEAFAGRSEGDGDPAAPHPLLRRSASRTPGSRVFSSQDFRRLMEDKAVAREVFIQTVERYEASMATLEKQLQEQDQQIVDLKKQLMDLLLQQEDAAHQQSHHQHSSSSSGTKSRDNRMCMTLTPPAEAPFISSCCPNDDPTWAKALGLGLDSESAHAAASRLPQIHKLLQHRRLPVRLRQSLWLRCIGNSLQITPDLFSTLQRQLQWTRLCILRSSSKYATKIAEVFRNGDLTQAGGGGGCCCCYDDDDDDEDNDNVVKVGDDTNNDNTDRATVTTAPTTTALRGSAALSALSDHAIPLAVVTAFEAIAVDLPRCLSCYTAPSFLLAPGLAGGCGGSSNYGDGASVRNSVCASSTGVGDSFVKLSGECSSPSETEAEWVETEERRVCQLLQGSQRVWLLSRVRDILEMFCIFRPDIGYTQGMDSLAVVIAITEAGSVQQNASLTLPRLSASNCTEATVEEPAPDWTWTKVAGKKTAGAASFCLFANLACRQPEASFLRLDPSTLQGYCEAFAQSVNTKVTQLMPVLSLSGVPVESFLVEWLLTRFARALPLHIVPLVWDEILAFGDAALLRIAVATVRYWHNVILGGGQLSEQAVRQFASEGLRRMSREQTLNFVQLHLQQRRNKSVVTRTGKAILKFIGGGVSGGNTRKAEGGATGEVTEGAARRNSLASTTAADEEPAVMTPVAGAAAAASPNRRRSSKSFMRLWR